MTVLQPRFSNRPHLAELLAERIGKPAAEAVPSRFAEFLRWVGRDPSPVVEAICDASQGLPVTSIDDELAVRVFGCERSKLPTTLLRRVVVRAGGRGGKTSRLLAPKALHAALTVPLPTLAPGEHAVSLLVAPRQKEAIQALSFVRGILEARPELARMVDNRIVQLGSERLGAAEKITIRRHSGQLVDITIGVAGNGGLAARAKTLVYAGFDEAAFFRDEGAETDKALYQAAIQRIVPGGQLWMVSTPWIEGFGVMEELLKEDWGRHRNTLCAMGGTRMLNPNWDPDHTIEDDLRRTDPDNARREIDAIPLPAGSKLFFPPEVLSRSVNEERPRELPPLRGVTHYAAVDLGFRKNSSTLAIARREGRTVRLVYHEEVQPERGRPLVPSEVISGFARVCARYGAWTMVGDYHYVDTAHEELRKLQFYDRENDEQRRVSYQEWMPTADSVTDAFTRVRTLMSEGLAEVPNDPRLLSQLRLTASKPMPGGAMKVELPRIGAAHGDLALVSVVAMSLVDTTDGIGLSSHNEDEDMDRYRSGARGF